jgi:hypothetical protein
MAAKTRDKLNAGEKAVVKAHPSQKIREAWGSRSVRQGENIKAQGDVS